MKSARLSECAAQLFRKITSKVLFILSEVLTALYYNANDFNYGRMLIMQTVLGRREGGEGTGMRKDSHNTVKMCENTTDLA